MEERPVLSEEKNVEHYVTVYNVISNMSRSARSFSGTANEVVLERGVQDLT